MDNLKLIDLLVQNPRASITDLADILGQTEETVDRAKKDLEEQKIICGYHTMVNWDKANIDVSAKPERGSGYDKIAERIAHFPEVSSLFLMSGNSEFLVNVNGKTMREVADFVGEKLAPIEGVAATVTMFVLKKYKVNGVTMDLHSEAGDERMPVSA